MKENESRRSGRFHRASALLRLIGSCPVCIGRSLTCKAAVLASVSFLLRRQRCFLHTPFHLMLLSPI